MFPAPFTYHAPTTIDEALAILRARGGDARPLAGGQSLVAAMNLGVARPAVIVDLNSVAGLEGITVTDDGLTIGALVRQGTLERAERVRSACPLLAEAAALIGNPRVRSRGTLGGSLAHADPAAELPAVLLALGAELRIASVDGERSIPAAEFTLGPLTTVLAEDELLVGVHVPHMPPHTGWAFEEIARRPGDFAIAGVAATLTLGADGRCSDARLAFCGAGPTPVRAMSAEALLRGRRPDSAAIAAAGDAAAGEIDVADDALVSAGYRRHLAQVLAARALALALARVAQLDEVGAA